jgi:2-polyprenyl-3-methyl-5-hydroxy-6-metoxy-1,4-benzoquinol methylase
MRREERRQELLDGPLPRRDRDAALADIDRLSTWFGGHALTIRAVRRLLAGAPAVHRPRVVVDVGGGRGDLARRIACAMGRHGGSVRVVLLDRNLETLALAGVAGRTGPEVLRVCADATALPFRDEGVDVVTASLVLHHLSPDAAVASLAAMREAARLGVVVNDLLRTRPVWLLVLVGTWLFARRVSRHDGPLSVRRAYAPDELRALGEKAGWPRMTIRRYPPLGRLVATAP